MQKGKQQSPTWQNRENIWISLQVKSNVAVLEEQVSDAVVAGKRQEIKKGDAVSTFTIIFNIRHDYEFQ